MEKYSRFRRLFLQGAGLLGAGVLAGKAQAHHTDTHFEDRSSHQLVYQCNKSDDDYQLYVIPIFAQHFAAGKENMPQVVII